MGKFDQDKRENNIDNPAQPRVVMPELLEIKNAFFFRKHE